MFNMRKQITYIEKIKFYNRTEFTRRTRRWMEGVKCSISW